MSGITDPAEAFFKDGQWGFDGNVWRKLRLLFGYGEIYRERIEDLNADVTFDSLSGSVVPEGEIWIVNTVLATDIVSNLARISIYITGDGVTTDLDQVVSPVKFTPAKFSGHAVMVEDEFVGAYFEGTVAGDDIFLSVRGYKMLIAA